MNANELADEIEQGKDGFRRDLIVTMLRQLQAENEALKDKLMLSKQSLEIVEGWIRK